MDTNKKLELETKFDTIINTMQQRKAIKNETLLKKCDDLKYAMPALRINNRLYGKEIYGNKKADLCMLSKKNAQIDYDTLDLIYHVIDACYNKLKMLTYGPICISTPGMPKNKCSNWKTHIPMPDESINQSWYSNLNKLITEYVKYADVILIKIDENMLYHDSIRELLRQLIIATDKIFTAIITTNIHTSKTKKAQNQSTEKSNSAMSAKKNAIRIQQGLAAST